MITLGARLVGKVASDRAQAALTDMEGGGAIQLGERLLGKPSIPMDPVVPQKVARATGNSVPKKTKGDAVVPITGAPAVALSEQDIELMLASDPNTWDRVCETETVRPEGWRPAVAHMVLNAAHEAKEKPIPAAVLTELRATVARSTADDIARFQQLQAEAAARAEAAGPPQE